MPYDISNKWALVTGASRGIGQQIALGLAQQKCNLILHARTADNLSQSLALVEQYPIDVVSVCGELGDEKALAAIIETVNRYPGKVDILFNNAAINCESTPIFEFSLKVWREIFEVNLMAMVTLCKAFCPGMKERNWGRVINMSSGIAGQPNLAPYSVSKAAVDKLTQDLASEFENTAVRANYLDPGWIQTDLGGPDAWEPVESVLPGVLVPVLIDDDGPNGKFFEAQTFKNKKLSEINFELF